MRILPSIPTVKNPPEWFTGDVRLDQVVSPQEEGQRMSAGLVGFAPGARHDPPRPLGDARGRGQRGLGRSRHRREYQGR